MHTLFRSVAGVLLGFLLVVNSAHATTYYWIRGSTQFSSAAAACPSTIDAYNVTFSFNGVHYYSVDGATCKYTYTSSSSGETTNITYYSISRYGNSCPDGYNYDNVIGGCVAPTLEPGEECLDQTGGTPSDPMIWDSTVNQCVKFSESEGKAPCTYLQSKGGESPFLVSGTILSGGYVAAPPTFASTSTDCEVQLVRSSKCVVRVTGEAQCVVIGEYSGEVFGGGTDINDALCPDGGCPENEAETTTDSQDCEPVSNGSGGTSCTTMKTTEAEGEQSCGTFNGVLTCTAKSPASNGVTSNITATTETEPDGDIKVTTVKDSSLTLCTDINSCTTKHSTTTSVTTTKPSGATSTTSSCTGACSSTGGGVETVPGAGTQAGNGSGTCIGEDCGAGEEQGTAATVDTCDETPPCEGDPFQCAMLIQAHYDTCKLMAGPTSEEQAESDARIDGAWAQYDANQAVMDGEATTLLGQFQASIAGGGGGGVCLQDVPFTLQGHTIVIEFSRVCDSIAFIRLGMLVVAYLIAARIVLRSTEA